MISVSIAALILRFSLGITMIAHGYNHAFGGGRLPGTARWFESIGMRPARLHACLATVTELGAGFLLLLGLLMPLAVAGVVGTMTVALVANHLRNGFFIFRPGEGYEYVLMILLASCALSALGSGRWSLDYVAGINLDGGWSLLCAAMGAVVACAVLVTCWRPQTRSADKESALCPETDFNLAGQNN